MWQQLGLDKFWQQRLPEGREGVSWEKVLRLLVVNRLIDHGSEFRLHRQWFVDSAMDELLNTADCTTLKGFLKRIEDTYGRARRIWIMDRGIPTEAILQ